MNLNETAKGLGEQSSSPLNFCKLITNCVYCEFCYIGIIKCFVIEIFGAVAYCKCSSFVFRTASDGGCNKN